MQLVESGFRPPFRVWGFALIIVAVNSYAQTGIASRYPGDVGIQNDSNIIFVEIFEEPNIAAVISNWTDFKNSTQMALVPDVPIGSTGKTSIQFTTVGGKVNAVHLYKLLSPGINDSLFFCAII